MGDFANDRPRPIDQKDMFEGECRVRDYYATQLESERPGEILVRREQRYPGCGLRADMRTVDTDDVLREWEFKIFADYHALGQILQYVALARTTEGFRPIRGVIAAFTFSDELVLANEVLNLNLELVTIPMWMAQAGGVPARVRQEATVQIPFDYTN